MSGAAIIVQQRRPGTPWRQRSFPLYQAEAGPVLLETCRYFPLQKPGFVSSCSQGHLWSITGFGLFLRKFKGDPVFWVLLIADTSGAAATVAVNWSQLKAGFVSQLPFTNIPKAVDGARGVTDCELLWVRVVHGPYRDHVLPTHHSQKDHRHSRSIVHPEVSKTLWDKWQHWGKKERDHHATKKTSCSNMCPSS